MHSLTVLKTRCLKLRFYPGHVPCETGKGILCYPFLPSAGLPAISGVPWFVSAQFQFVFMVTWHSPSVSVSSHDHLILTPIILNQCPFYSSMNSPYLITSAKILFSSKSHSVSQGSLYQTPTYLFGEDTIQPIIIKPLYLFTQFLMYCEYNSNYIDRASNGFRNTIQRGQECLTLQTIRDITGNNESKQCRKCFLFLIPSLRHAEYNNNQKKNQLQTCKLYCIYQTKVDYRNYEGLILTEEYWFWKFGMKITLFYNLYS